MRPTPTASAPLAVLAALLALSTGCSGKKAVSCPAGESDCGGICFDLQTNARSCGTCLRACPVGAVCLGGTCQCPASTVSCGGTCVDLATSQDHCGGCDQPCGSGTCQAGACDCGATTACPAPAPGEPRCADTQADPANCGACGTVCGLGRVCQAGGCVCPPPRTECGAAGCLDLATDARHCGTTCQDMVACPAGASCASGACACTEGQDVCGGACVDLTRDAANCGACGRTCALEGVCQGGACACPASLPTLCGAAPGVCVDATSDPANCGGCGAADPRFLCGTGQACLAGLCCGEGQRTCGAGAARLCCDGTQCCAGGACQASHSNGLGQRYLSCDPVPTYTRDAALAAARAWTPSGGTIFEAGNGLLCAGTCLCLQATAQAATWCYEGALAGQVSLNTVSTQCLCPPQGNTTGPWD